MKVEGGKPLDLVDPNAIEQLFEVAAELFAERGIDGVSVREISRLSNVSIAAIYYHFKSKEGLFAEVCLHKYEDFERELLKRINAHVPGPATPVAVALAFFDMMTADNNLLRLFQRDMIAGTRTHEHFLSLWQDHHFRRLIDKALGFDPDNPQHQMKSFSLAALVNGYSEVVMSDIDGIADKVAHLQKHRRFLEQFVEMAFRT